MQNKSKSFLISAITFCLIGMLLVFSFTSYQKGHFIDTAYPERALETNNLHGETTVLVFRQNGCRDCAKIERPFSNLIARKNLSKKVIVINVRNAKRQHFIKEFGLERTPTFVVVKKGNVMMTYTGTNMHQIQRLLLDQEALQDKE